jgi:hypothetical protein
LPKNSIDAKTASFDIGLYSVLKAVQNASSTDFCYTLAKCHLATKDANIASKTVSIYEKC